MFEELTLEQITASSLIVAWAFIQALVLEYVPGLKDKFGKLSPQWKASSQAISLLAVVLAVFGLGCGGIVPSIGCTQSTALYLLMTWIGALMSNQTSHNVFKTRS